MRVDAFSYELPAELVAQRPAPEREAARLLVVADGGGLDLDRTVAELPLLLPPGALVVLNDTRVFPARLLGKKSDTGGRVEIFLVRFLGTRGIEGRDAFLWRALGRASKGLRPGTEVSFGEGRLVARILDRAGDDGLLDAALWTTTGESVDDAVRALGRVPLPPYIKRDAEAEDARRYQTVYARTEGAVAAPTAGLHLTHELLARLRANGCETATLTLHVGLGTFAPVSTPDLDDHPMHAESFSIPEATALAVARAKERGAPVVAVGTTVVRALESAVEGERVVPTAGETRLLIQPGFRFRVVDRLLTNFHLPQSTLLALVCAFGGTERVLAAYEAAVCARFRFYSYGDAMLLPRAV